MDKSSPRPQSPGAEIYRDRLRKSCQHNFVIVTNFFITLRDQIYRQGFGKKLSGETKGRMAGLLSRVETESCKCCKCCKFRPDLNLSAKIWSLYWKPTTEFSPLSYSINAAFLFGLMKQAWHQFPNNWPVGEHLFKFCAILSMIICLFDFAIITLHDWFDCAFSWDLGFIFLRQKLDNWIYTT